LGINVFLDVMHVVVVEAKRGKRGLDGTEIMALRGRQQRLK
jgi:hypothetical protein